MEQIERRIEGNFSQGWATAALVIGLVATGFAVAGFIHSKTYHHPRDTSAPYRQEKGHGQLKEGPTSMLER